MNNSNRPIDFSTFGSSTSMTSCNHYKKASEVYSERHKDKNNFTNLYPEIQILRPYPCQYGSMDSSDNNIKPSQNAEIISNESYCSSSAGDLDTDGRAKHHIVYSPVNNFVSNLEVARKFHVKDNFRVKSDNCHHTSTPTIIGYDSPQCSKNDASTNDNLEGTFAIRIKKSPSRFSRRQWSALLGVCYVNFSSNASLSILSSFFTREAYLHGVGDVEVGLIFGCYAVVNTIFCPIFGYVVPRVGTKLMLLIGMLISSICSFIFSQLYRVTTTPLYILGCLLSRGIQALGCAAYFTGSTVIVAQEWRENMTFAIGLGEIFSGLGMITGPLMGGWIYEQGGFQLPFIVIGIIMFIGLFVNYYALPNEEVKTSPGNFLSLMKIPNVAVTSIFMCVMWAAMDFNMPMLSIHMEKLDASPVLVGSMFLIMAASYTLFAPLIGIYAKTKIAERSTMISGSIFVGISFLLIGPSPIFSIFYLCDASVTSIVLSMILLGGGLSAAIVPTFNDLNNSAVSGGMKDDLTTAGLVCGVFNGATFLGEFLGPTIGGAMMDYYHNYKMVSSWFSAMIFCVVVIVAIFYVVDWRRRRHADKVPCLDTVQQINDTTDASPLID